MSRFTRESMIALAALLALAPAPLRAENPSTTIPATATVYDQDTAGATTLTRSDDYNGVFQATYTNTGNAVGAHGVSSTIFVGSGAWQLYLGNQSVRKICVTFSPAGGSAPAPVPNGCYYQNAELYATCFDASLNEVGIRGIPPGMANNRCAFFVDLSLNKVKYQLAMSPKIAQTGWATVSCATSAGATCYNWTITPNPISGNGNNALIANLYRFTNTGLVFVGSYYNTYRVDLTTQ